MKRTLRGSGMADSLLIITWVHVALSVIMLVAGIVVVRGLLRGHDSGGWTTVFLVTAIGTNAGSFAFPFAKLLPSHITAIIALVLLAVTLLARHAFALSGSWRWIYAVGLTFTLFFDVFVLVAQAFGKIPGLHRLAPTQSEPPFAVVELVVLAAFVVLAVIAGRRFDRA